jgi:hypothetical protein
MPAWEWQYWHDRLNGKPVEMTPNDPQAGFYREPRRAEYGARKTFRPVAYWPGENGQLHCRLGDEDVSDQRGVDLWTRVGHHPVTEAAYRTVAQDGGLWPDEHELVPMQGDNQPPPDDSYEGLRDEIEKLARDAGERLKGPPIADQDEADRLANLGNRLEQLAKQVEDNRKAERAPHDAACIEIQKKWVPLRDLAETYKLLKRTLVTPWLNKLTQQKKKEAEAAAAAGTPVSATESARRPRAGTRGRAMTLKTVKRAQIDDYDACWTFFKDAPEMRDLVQSLANRVIRTGMTVPGTTVVTEEMAV